MFDLWTRVRSALPDRYEIRRELGRGGMATVFLAEDRKHARPVAIKVVRADRASPAGSDRFLQEIRTTARLQHPHILPLHDSGFCDGLLYYVMPYVDGESLRDRLDRETTLTIDESLRIAGEVADALDYAHANDVVHRDVKPENILLSGAHAMLADFGIAHALQKAADDRLTTTGVVLGTPRYMSPEQLTGGHVDGRTDQFALACATYEMLAGRPPFEYGVAAGNVRGKARSVSTVRIGIDPCVDRALERALAVSPVDRFATVREFADALSRVEARPESPEPPNNLPPRISNFVGREAELEDCRELLGRSRLLALSGIGGAGKTRLALRLAEGKLHEFPGGVWFIDLAPIAEPGRVAPSVATVLRVRPEPDQTQVQALVGRLASTRCLLLLDNCEHVLDACAELATVLLRSCGELKLVVTSREALGVPGEVDYVVPPLSLPQRGPESDLARIASADSVRLFVERAALVRAGFRLTQDNANTIAEVCRELDGIPLAIELAAARVRVLSVQEIHERLADRFRFLVDRGHAPARHQTLRATLEWSYEPLSDDEQRLFRALAVFVGGWRLSGAVAVFDDHPDEYAVLDQLTRLVEKSLVVVDRSESPDSRYRLLETVRQFANERLEERGERDAARHRHFEYFFKETAEAGGMLLGGRQPIALARLELEHENLLAALAWCESSGRGDRALRFASSLWRFWYARGHGRLGLDAFERLLSRKDVPAGSPERLEALLGAGLLALDQGDYVACRRLYEEALALASEVNDRAGIARALNGLGAVTGDGEGNYEAAWDHFQHSLALNREIGNKQAQGVVLSNLGEVALRLGRFVDALALSDESLRLRREVGDRQGVGITQLNAAMASLRLGDLGGGSRRLAEALDCAQELGQRPLGANALDVCAEFVEMFGDAYASGVLTGAADALREGAGSRRAALERAEAEAVRERLRRALGGDRLATAVGEGRRLQFGAAISLAIETLRERGRPRTAEGGSEL